MKKVIISILIFLFVFTFPIKAEELNGLITKDGNTYYYKDGELQRGFQEIEGKTYFFSNDKTRLGVMRTGKFNIGEDTYIFNDYLQTDLFEYEGNKYYADKEGKLLRGMQEIEGKTYFFSNDRTRLGVMRTGKFNIGEDTYIFNDYLQTDLFEYNGDKYYADKEGKLLRGRQIIEDKEYYFSNDKTRLGVMRTGKINIYDNTYIYNEYLQTDLFEYNGDKYYADASGKLQLGMQEIDGEKYFFSRDKTRLGVMRTGTFQIGYNLYTFDNEGRFQSIQYLPSYYNQKDPRWANKKYGKGTIGTTGCAPTSMAMAFQSILEKLLLPTDIASYLYNYTNEYNHYTTGSSGLAIIKASEYFGVDYKPLKNKDELVTALKNGHIVFAAMGNGKYATKYYNHAIILYDYSNGKTKAMDPLKTSNNGWVEIDLIIREQSKDPDDSRGGSNFYELSTK